ncbi:MAG TPA: hypothetical protein VF188_07890 [Longimicrobiales bacterium]
MRVDGDELLGGASELSRALAQAAGRLEAVLAFGGQAAAGTLGAGGAAAGGAGNAAGAGAAAGGAETAAQATAGAGVGAAADAATGAVADGTHTLELELGGEAGTAVVVTIVGDPDPTFTVFGPERYELNILLPSVTTTHFTRPAAAGAPFWLEVVNGAPDGSHRVLVGSVRLNGRLVVGPLALLLSPGHVIREVDLDAENVLEVRLATPPGSFLSVRVRGTDVAAPVLEITAPAAGLVTNAADITASGRVIDQTVVQVAVNGTAAAVGMDGAFSLAVPLESEGENELRFSAIDAAGHRTDSLRVVVRDTEAPVVVWSAPAEGLITREAVVRIAGSVADRTAVGVSVNGSPLAVDAAGAFTGELTLSEGANALTLVATDEAGNSTVLVRNVVRDTTPPVLIVSAPEDSAVVEGESVAVSGTVTDQTAVTLTLNGEALAVAADGTFSGEAALAEGANMLTFTATDAAGNTSTVVRTVLREGADLPPDPATVAPSLDPTVATALHAASAFLYTGPDPIQVGVDPDTIDPVRLAVVRGRVLTREGLPLAGVTVTVKDHPEYGHTLSRADGMYDLAVNGGGLLVLDFEKAGYLPAQRPVEAPWQDYVLAEDVALVPLDTVVTTIDLAGATEVQVARGSVVADSDGVRQATLLFEPGTTAEMVLPDGSTQPLSTLSVRATEYTVGPGGPMAMPGPLPPGVGYTYAVELSADEAIAAGAESVVFSRPVVVYVDNFLHFPVGEPVPVGFYDRKRAQWVPEDNGQIIGILGQTAEGLAMLDVDGDSVADADSVLAVLGITAGERERLASLYPAGKSLWRVPTLHFSPGDFNWPMQPPATARPPGQPRPQPGGPPPCGDTPVPDNSLIGCESQTLSEAVAVTGTPFTLHYRSRRVPGRKAAYTMEIPLTGPVLPDSLERVKVQVDLAGRRRLIAVGDVVSGFAAAASTTSEPVVIDPGFGATFDAEPNLRFRFRWDGKDVYGRPVQGRQTITVHIGYVYPAVYGTALLRQAFGIFSGIPMEGDPLRQEYTLWQRYRTQIGPWDARGLGLGGWSLDVHHAYDPVSHVLYRGDGRVRAAEDLPEVITTVAGMGINGSREDGHPALETNITNPFDVAIGPDGTLYIAHGNDGSSTILRVGPDGIVHTLVGTAIGEPVGMALGPDGYLYVADRNKNRVFRVDPKTGVLTYDRRYRRRGVQRRWRAGYAGNDLEHPGRGRRAGRERLYQRCEQQPRAAGEPERDHHDGGRQRSSAVERRWWAGH